MNTAISIKFVELCFRCPMSLSLSTVVNYFIQVLGGFDASNYVTERKWVTASDCTQIPISIVYRKNLVKLDGSDLLLLYGYGSYEVISHITL